MSALGTSGCRLRGCGLGAPAAWPAPAAPGPALCAGIWGRYRLSVRRLLVRSGEGRRVPWVESVRVQSGIVVGFAGWLLHGGTVVRCGESVWGTMYTLCCAVCGVVAWSLFEGGLLVGASHSALNS